MAKVTGMTMTKVKIDWRILSLFDIASTVLQIDVPITPILSVVPITAISLKVIWIIYVKAAIVNLPSVLALLKMISFTAFKSLFSVSLHLLWFVSSCFHPHSTSLLPFIFFIWNVVNSVRFISSFKSSYFLKECFVLGSYILTWSFN